MKRKFRDLAMRWAVLFLAVLVCAALLPSRALAVEPNIQVAVTRVAGDDITFDETRYLNQNNWYQNTWWKTPDGHENAAASVWWAGFSRFEHSESEPGMPPFETNQLIPEENAHVKSVTMTHLKDGRRDGTVYQVPKGNGTNAVSGSPVYLYQTFPEALPKNSVEHNKDANAYPTAHNYVECSQEEATHLTVKWYIDGMPSYHNNLGLLPRGTHNWNAALGLVDTVWVRTSNHILEEPVASEELYGLPVKKDVTFYKAVMPDRPKPGHDFAIVEITPEFGYYVTDVVVTCCFNGNAYTNCSVYNTGHAFQQNFGVNKGDTVSLILDSESFSHGSNGAEQMGHTSKYYIMIRTEPVSDQMFVEYDPGLIVKADVDGIEFNEDGKWLVQSRRGNPVTKSLSGIADQVGDLTHVWEPGDLDYRVDAVREDVLHELSVDGWQFVGWDLEYYPEAVTDGKVVVFNGNRWNEMAVDPDDSVRLKMHAKLTALWEEAPLSATVTKTVAGLEPDDATERSFRFKLTKADGTPVPFEGKKQAVVIKEGRESIEFVDDKSTDGTFSIEITGNGSLAYRFYDLPDGEYRVEELVGDDAGFKVSYSTQSFTVRNGVDAPSEISVTNDFGTEAPGFELPKTGGVGTGIYMVTGCSTVLLAGLLLAGRKMRRG